MPGCTETPVIAPTNHTQIRGIYTIEDCHGHTWEAHCFAQLIQGGSQELCQYDRMVFAYWAIQSCPGEYKLLGMVPERRAEFWRTKLAEQYFSDFVLLPTSQGERFKARGTYFCIHCDRSLQVVPVCCSAGSFDDGSHEDGECSDCCPSHSTNAAMRAPLEDCYDDEDRSVDSDPYDREPLQF